MDQTSTVLQGWNPTFVQIGCQWSTFIEHLRRCRFRFFLWLYMRLSFGDARGPCLLHALWRRRLNSCLRTATSLGRHSRLCTTVTSHSRRYPNISRQLCGTKTDVLIRIGPPKHCHHNLPSRSSSSSNASTTLQAKPDYVTPWCAGRSAIASD